MLFGVLNSKLAIDVNISIMRAFVVVRQMVAISPISKIAELEKKIEQITDYVEDIFKDQNDINEDTQMQLDLINQALAELQNSSKNNFANRNKIGFKQSEK